MGGSTTTVSAPGPSSEETAINKKILDLLNKQERDMEVFKPILMDEYGIEEVMQDRPDFADLNNVQDYMERGGSFGSAAKDEQVRNTLQEYTNSWEKKQGLLSKLEEATQAGKTAEATQVQEELDQIEQFRQGVRTDLSKLQTSTLQLTAERKAENEQIGLLDKANREIALAKAERQKLALEGKIPISTGTSLRKQEQFSLLKEGASRMGHTIEGDAPESAVSDSTAGSQLLGEFNRTWGLLEDAERRGEISEGGASFLNSYGAAKGTQVTGVPQTNYAGLVPQYVSALQPYQNNRNMQFSANAATQQNKTQMASGLLQAIGTGAGMYAAFASSELTKKDVRQLSDAELDMLLEGLAEAGVFSFDYLHQNAGGTSHIGPIVEKLPPILVNPDGMTLNTQNLIGALFASVISLKRQVKQLQQPLV